MSTGREGRGRRRKLERRARKFLARAPKRRPNEGTGEYAERLKPWVREHAEAGTGAEELWGVMARMLAERDDFGGAGQAPDSWLALTRRFGRREGGSIHITNPAIELLAAHGFDEGVVIYKHFEGGGTEGGVRSYWQVGESNEERIGVVYAPEQDAVVIWRWGESEHDPGAAVLAEHDEDPTASRTAGEVRSRAFLERVHEGYWTMIDLAMLAPTTRAVAVMWSEGADPLTLKDRYEHISRERSGKHLVVWEAYDGEFELCVYRHDDEDRTRVWLRDEFDAAEEPRPLYRAGQLGGL